MCSRNFHLPESTVNRLVENVAAIWQRTAPTRGIQMIFADLGGNPTPWGYSPYEEIIEKLVAKGIPRRPDRCHRRRRIRRQETGTLRESEARYVRVLTGKTQKMGTARMSGNAWLRCITLTHPGSQPKSSNATARISAREMRTRKSRSIATSPKDHSTPICGKPWRPRPGSFRIMLRRSLCALTSPVTFHAGEINSEHHISPVFPESSIGYCTREARRVLCKVDPQIVVSSVTNPCLRANRRDGNRGTETGTRDGNRDEGRKQGTETGTRLVVFHPHSPEDETGTRLVVFHPRGTETGDGDGNRDAISCFPPPQPCFRKHLSQRTETGTR